MLVPALVPERFSNPAEDWIGVRLSGSLAISGWTHTEVASALAQKQRAGAITAERRAQAAEFWKSISGLMTLARVEPDDFAIAAELVDAGLRGLRSGDALHLAVARRADFALATFDRDLADAAEAVGVEVALRPPA